MVITVGYDDTYSGRARPSYAILLQAAISIGMLQDLVEGICRRSTLGARDQPL
jgi:hypothetical protein